MSVPGFDVKQAHARKFSISRPDFSKFRNFVLGLVEYSAVPGSRSTCTTKRTNLCSDVAVEARSKSSTWKQSRRKSKNRRKMISPAMENKIWSNYEEQPIG